MSISSFIACAHADHALPFGLEEAQGQKGLSKAIDERLLASLTDPSCVDVARRAHLKLLQASGAGLWLQAQPSKTMHLHVEPALYVASLRRWLWIPFAQVDSFCPLCDGIMDSYGDHALACCGGGIGHGVTI